MPTEDPCPTPAPARPLPDRPDLRHLKDQAKDVLKAGKADSLSAAQLQIARLYGFASWPRLKAHVEFLGEVGRLKAAIDANDLEKVKAMMTRNPALHRAPLGYGKNGPLTWVAECRVPRQPPTPARLEMAQWMIDQGSDVHQGGDGPLMRAALDDDRIPMMDLLVRNDADVNAKWNGNYPIVCAPCETLAPGALKWLLEHGADLRVDSQYGPTLSMVLGTYGRDPVARAACLEIFAERGDVDLPDTAPMALHRRRFDLLERHLARDPGVISRTFTEQEIYPPALGMRPTDGLTAAPIGAGVTLLHLAIEYDDLDMARWLIEHGADVNARAAVDEQGYGGHTPIFHAVVTLGGRDDAKAALLLEAGAHPALRATIRKQLKDMGDPEKETLREFHDVTAVEFAEQFVEPRFVSRPAVDLILKRGGGA
jgi:ankyrin repeat protein